MPTTKTDKNGILKGSKLKAKNNPNKKLITNKLNCLEGMNSNTFITTLA